MAGLYLDQERYKEAEPLFRRVFEQYKSQLGESDQDALVSANNLAIVYGHLGRHAEAERLNRHTLEVEERVLGAEHPLTLGTINNLAWVYRKQGRYKQAEPLNRRAVDALERVLGKEHPNTLISITSLAALYSDMGRYAEAERLYERALTARQRVLGRDHPNTIGTISNLAELHFARRNWSRAAQFWERSTVSIAKRVLRSAQDARVTGNKQNDAERQTSQFKGLAKATYRLAPEGPIIDAARINQTFQTAQWALSSEAAKSLVQMAARGAKGDAKLAGLIRERQDLVAEWRKLDAQRNAWLGQAEDANLARFSAIDKRIAEIDKRLAADFPDYASLASPVPLSIEETQAQLGTDEALVLVLDTEALKPEPEETFIWVVTKTDRRWVRSDLGTEALRGEVQALRCGLDLEVRKEARCANLASQHQPQAVASAGSLMRFDLARAHDLYKALFGRVEDLIKDKHLLIVPSGALTQLPFQVLVKTPSANDDYRSAAWLVRDHAVTVLPAVSSLKALRGVAHPSTATKPMIGFGNPLLDGPQNNPQSDAFYKQLAQQARDNQHCRELPLQRVMTWLGLARGVTPMEMRDGLAQVSQIRTLVPLPETADELCAVARDLKAEVQEIRLGGSATEHEVKSLSASGKLAEYRIIHFATHGALAGQVGNREPGLILTPPAKATSDDDGYLSASEIAALKLDADWVILSACNTAAGDATNSEALSGLARAFIYAQARALLVSHWAVNSNATVKLITTAMTEMTTDQRVGRAEALRRAMLALINKGSAQEAHPSYWAPFIVVGEGAR